MYTGKSGAEIMAQAAREREERENAEPWIKPALKVLRETSRRAKNQNSDRIGRAKANMTPAERAAQPAYVDEDIEIVKALRAHFAQEAS